MSDYYNEPMMMSIQVFNVSWQDIESSFNRACLLKTSHYWANVDVFGGGFGFLFNVLRQVSQVFHVPLHTGIAFVKVLILCWGVIVRIR